MFTISTSYLDNGLKIMLRNVPNQRTVSCGIFVGQGVKDEDESNNGISHLIEHLMFKINSKHSKTGIKENLQELKYIGARYNATTTKDYTCFSIDGLSRDINKMLEVLSYLVVDKEKVSKEDLNVEKEVVLREAEGYLMSSSQIGERIGQALWGDYSIGQLVIGKKDVIRNIEPEMVDYLIYNAYIPENCVLVIVGGFDTEVVLQQVNKYFSAWEDKNKYEKKYITKAKPGIYIDDSFSGGRSTIGIGLLAYCSNDWRSRYVELLKDVLVKPGSKLFYELREKKGLVYSIYGISTALMTSGNMGIAFSANNNQVEDIIKIVIDELRYLVSNGVDEGRLENIKRGRETEILYGIESTANQLNAIGKSAIRGDMFLLEDEIREINKINKDKLDQVIKDLFLTENLCMAVLGDVNIDNLLPLLEF